MITVYTLTYNEELMIQFMIDHYRTRFPGCRIVVNDNMSTDNTVKIALANGCAVITFDTNNRLDEHRLTAIRNSCWKNATTDWVLMCDLDELLDINEEQLKIEAAEGVSIIKAEGYDMVDMGERLNITGIKYGARDVGHDKFYLFNKRFISEINYSLGAHAASPKGIVKFSKRLYKLYHYCYINYRATVKRFKLYRSRVKTGGYYSENPDQIRNLYQETWSKAVKVR